MIIVEKKQLNVLFLQIVVDISIRSGYYCSIVTRKVAKAAKGVLSNLIYSKWRIK